MNPTTFKSNGGNIRRYSAFFLLLIVAVAGFGYWYLKVDAESLIAVHHETLASVGKLKVAQIEGWRSDRLFAATRAARDPYTVEFVTRAIGSRDDPAILDQVKHDLHDEVGDPEAADLLLFDKDERPIFGTNDPVSTATREAVHTVLATETPAFSDFFRHENKGVKIDVAAPVCGSDGKLIAVLVVRHAASAYLFPMLAAWPTGSPSSESVLVRRDGDSILFLNDLRHQPGQALALKIPLSQTSLPASHAIFGEAGRFRGRDYRGVDVLADMRGIKDSPWFLITKMDFSEVTAKARDRALVVALIVGLITMIVAAGVSLFYRARQHSIRKRLHLARDDQRTARETALSAERKSREILENTIEGFWMLDRDGRILSANKAVCRMLGYTAEELCMMTISDLQSHGSGDDLLAHIGSVITRGSDFFESTLRRKDGAVIDVDVSAQFRADEGRIVVFLRDITERRRDQSRLERLSSLFAAQSRCNEAIVLSKTEEELYKRVCEVVVQKGDIKMAWVAVAGPETGTVTTAASAGLGTEYIEHTHVSTRGDDPRGLGPVGTAIRTGEPVWCHDFANDPSTKPWHELASRYGWKACAAIPLRRRAVTLGALLVYSEKQHTFSEDVQELLTEIGDNISFALDNFAREKEKRHAEQNLEILLTAVEQSANTIVLTDVDGLIEYANPAFEKSSGYSVSEVIGGNPRVVKSGLQDREFYADLWSTITAGRIWRGELQNRRKDGTIYWESATISPVFNEAQEIGHYIAVKEDITDRKALECRLQDALEKAEAASGAKSEFLAVVSHELRTPLNGVLGFAELLAESPLTPEQSEFVATIRESGEHLLSLISDILDFSSIEKGRLHLNPSTISTGEFLETCCQSVRKTADDKGLAFHCHTAPGVPASFTADARRLRQILLNLLGNAVKFTQAGSITLSVATLESRSGTFLEFSVADTGIGMSDETMTKLFKPFTQGDSSLHRTYEGTGLGLAISQRLASAMGGHISVESAPEKGSKFTLRMPLDSPAPSLPDSPAVLPLPAEKPSRQGGRILIVEDDPVNTTLIKQIVVKLGFDVETADNGRKAVDAFAHGRFTAILMDLQMPVMNGIDATRAIRKLEQKSGTRVPIIALTANVMPRDRDDCVAAGMDDFVPKPFQKAALTAALSKHGTFHSST